MAKQRAVSKHSRAARRASSPSIDTDKSLKTAKPPTTASKPDVLAARHSAGISKKKRKVVLSTKARKRQEKSMDRAEAVMDRTSTKVEKSKGSFRTIQSRKKTWEEINRSVLGAGEAVPMPAAKKGKKAAAREEEDAHVKEFFGGGDEEMGGVVGEEGEAEKGAEGVPEAPGTAEEWEDEVL